MITLHWLYLIFCSYNIQILCISFIFYYQVVHSKLTLIEMSYINTTETNYFVNIHIWFGGKMRVAKFLSSPYHFQTLLHQSLTSTLEYTKLSITILFHNRLVIDIKSVLHILEILFKNYNIELYQIKLVYGSSIGKTRRITCL